MARDGAGRFHGILVIDKPAGWTSHDVIGRVRRLLGERQVGHSGTLDPFATGVLPVAVGDATRVLEYLIDADKRYVADVCFGVATDSHDIDGHVTATHPTTHLTEEMVDAALQAFRGPQLQIPPMHAAIKVNGKKLYELARKGEVIEREPRSVVFRDLTLLSWEAPVASISITCSKGTYIRALARDLGDMLGVGAYLSGLTRYETGGFMLCEALTLSELADTDLEGHWESIASHPDRVVEHFPVVLLDDTGERAWLFGQTVVVATSGAADVGDGALARVYSHDGTWRGIGRYDAASAGWRPVKVITESTRA